MKGINTTKTKGESFYLIGVELPADYDDIKRFLIEFDAQAFDNNSDLSYIDQIHETIDDLRLDFLYDQEYGCPENMYVIGLNVDPHNIDTQYISNKMENILNTIRSIGLSPRTIIVIGEHYEN